MTELDFYPTQIFRISEKVAEVLVSGKWILRHAKVQFP